MALTSHRHACICIEIAAEAFQMFDKKGDGVIDFEELNTVVYNVLKTLIFPFNYSSGEDNTNARSGTELASSFQHFPSNNIIRQIVQEIGSDLTTAQLQSMLKEVCIIILSSELDCSCLARGFYKRRHTCNEYAAA